MKSAFTTLALLAITLAACADRGADQTAMPAATAPAVEQPVADVATAPAAAPAQSPLPNPPPSDDSAGLLPAEGAIGFEGFGPARFGADAEAVRQAWGRELDGLPKESEGCYYLSPSIQPGSGYALAFMIEGGRFVRVDVARKGIGAPGGGEIGMSVEQVESLYPGLERRPHKYVEGGQYLRVGDPGGGDGVLVFETADGVVERWRVGLPPQVDYVEGCS